MNKCKIKNCGWLNWDTLVSFEHYVTLSQMTVSLRGFLYFFFLLKKKNEKKRSNFTSDPLITMQFEKTPNVQNISIWTPELSIAVNLNLSVKFSH
jgi:hypothetical protein